LKIKYPWFFDISRDEEVLVSECFEDNEWLIDFTRPLTISDHQSWDELLSDLKKYSHTHGRDEVVWALDKSRSYTTKSLYRFITDGGIRKSIYETLWKCKIPLRIKVFLWQVYNRKIQAVVVLKERDWKGSERCSLC
jgi:hypothetical protein